MTKLLPLSLFVSSFLLLTACQKPVAQKTQQTPPQRQPVEKVVQKTAPTQAVQDVPSQPQPSSSESVPAKQQSSTAPAKRSYKAGAIQTYSPTAYAEALADGKTVIIDFHASWCPICAANAPGIRAAFESTGNLNVVGFIADYDKETALENQFGVSSQSTLVKVRGSDPKSASKVGTLGPGPLTQEQVSAFIQS